ncbi:MAG: hypothetical protein ACYDD7_18905, partial [Acidimicrobiales bacterium]
EQAFCTDYVRAVATFLPSHDSDDTGAELISLACVTATFLLVADGLLATPGSAYRTLRGVLRSRFVA